MSLFEIRVAAVAVAFALPSIADDRTEFIVKIGVMEPATEGLDRLRRTRSLTMDPSRRPGFCFDFHDGDPIGTYQIRVFVNSALTASFDLQVTELDDHPEPDAAHRWNDPQRRADEPRTPIEREC